MAVLKTGVKKHTKTYTWNVYDVESETVPLYYWNRYTANKEIDVDSMTIIETLSGDISCNFNKSCSIQQYPDSGGTGTRVFSTNGDVYDKTYTCNLTNKWLEFSASTEFYQSYDDKVLTTTSSIDFIIKSSASFNFKYIEPSDYGEGYVMTVSISGTLYVFDGKSSSIIFKYTPASSLGRVNSTDRDAYPDNGYHDSTGYYYIWANSSSNITEYSQGSTLQNTLISYNPNKYPKNGKSGNYWYVRQ